MQDDNLNNNQISDDLIQMFEGPTDEGLDRETLSRVEAARQAFIELEKLTKNILLYGRGHQTTARFADRFYEMFSNILQRWGEVDLEVGPYEFTWSQCTVLENPTPDNNYIYKLYLDGVRRLVFRPSLTQDELDRFVDILLTDWNNVDLFEDDSVTLLWSANFEHIRYAVLDNFAEDIREDKDNIYTVPGVIQKVRTHGVFQQGEATSGHGIPRRLKRIDLGRSILKENDLEEFREVFFGMDEFEFRRLRTVVHTTGREKLEKFIEILFKVHLIQELSDEDRRGRITAIFDRIADLLLESGEIGQLERLLRIIRRLTGPTDRQVRENILAIEHIVEHWSEQAFISRVTAGLRKPGFTETPSVIAICNLLSRRSAPHIARIALHIDEPALRGQLLSVVKDKLSGQERSVADLLSETDKRGCRDIFSLLSQIIDPDELLYAVESAMKNHDPAVRIEALSVIPSNDLLRYQRLLINALRDRTKMVRSKAIHLVARIQKKSIAERIQNCIDADVFGGYDLDEKRRYYAAVALTGGVQQRWLEQFSKNTLIATKNQDDDRHCAAISLGICLSAEGGDILEKEAKRRLRSPLVKEGVTWALQHRACDRKERTRQLYELFFYGRLSTANTQGVTND